METRTKREIADALIAESFEHRQRIPIAELVAEALERGVSRRTLLRAAKSAHLTTIHNGPLGAFWEAAE